MSENESEDTAYEGKISTVVFVGLAITIVGVALVFLASVLNGDSGSVGGVIFIGPFPIVFGAGPSAVWLILVSLVIAALIVVLLMIWRRRVYRGSV